MCILHRGWRLYLQGRGAWGVGRGAWGVGRGAWGVGRGAWGVGRAVSGLAAGGAQAAIPVQTCWTKNPPPRASAHAEAEAPRIVLGSRMTVRTALWVYRSFVCRCSRRWPCPAPSRQGAAVVVGRLPSYWGSCLAVSAPDSLPEMRRAGAARCEPHGAAQQLAPRAPPAACRGTRNGLSSDARRSSRRAPVIGSAFHDPNAALMNA